MTSEKQRLVQQIRANSAYPVYRGVITIIAILGFIQAGFIALMAIVGGIGMMQTSAFMGFGALIGGVIFAVLCFYLVRFWQEAALILADIGDAITDMSANMNQYPNRNL